MKLAFFRKLPVTIFCSLLLLSACKKEAARGPEPPSLIRLSELIQDSKTEIDSHFTLTNADLDPLRQNGWEIGEKVITAKEKRAPFILPEWLWKSRDFRMKFTARSQQPRELLI